MLDRLASYANGSGDGSGSTDSDSGDNSGSMTPQQPDDTSGAGSDNGAGTDSPSPSNNAALYVPLQDPGASGYSADPINEAAYDNFSNDLSNLPTQVADAEGGAIGAAIGELIDPAGGGVPGYAIGSQLNVSGVSEGAAADASAMAPAIGTNYGSLGTVAENPGLSVTSVSSHGADAMTARGMSIDAVNSIVSSPAVVFSQGGGNTFLYFSQQGVAVLDRTGNLVTTYGPLDFRGNILNLARSVYGAK